MAAVEKVTSDNFNSMLAYSGHGMIEHHPANLTIAGVMGHELGHINSARNTALMTGDKIVSQDIKINYKFVNGRLIAEGGVATTVISKEEKFNNYKRYDNLSRADKKSDKAEKSAKASGAGASQKAADPKVEARVKQITQKLEQNKSQIEQKINMLQQELKSRESELTGAAGNAEFQAEDPARTQAPTSDGKNPELERKHAEDTMNRLKSQLEKIENMMASVEVARNIDMVNKLVQSVTDSSIATGLGLAALSAQNVAAAGQTTPQFPSVEEITFGKQGAGGSNEASAASGSSANPRPSAVESLINTIESVMAGALVNVLV